MTTVVVLLLGAWVVLTVLNQFERGRRWIQPLLRLDVLALIPSWTFFAPEPGRTDTHIVYRDIYDTGVAGCWRILVLRSRPGLLGLSHGERRVAKGVVDLQAELLDASGLPQPGTPAASASSEAPLQPASKRVMFSNAYLAILNLVSREEHDRFAVGTQFGLAISDRPDLELQARLVFISAIHSLRAPQPEPRA